MINSAIDRTHRFIEAMRCRFRSAAVLYRCEPSGLWIDSLSAVCGCLFDLLGNIALGRFPHLTTAT